jgi:N-acyl-D-amino-acid deacylase
MHDIVIRGGTILDGTGAAEFVGDVAIDLLDQRSNS